MALPFFYKEEITGDVLQLDEDSSKHLIQVLRKEKGAHLLLTDGKGQKAEAVIVDDNRKRCTVQVVTKETETPAHPKTAVGISLLKNSTRFEWFLEKATELGISEIYPLICQRTEKEKFRHDRLQAILASAGLQSQQSWWPQLHQPLDFEEVLHLPYPGKWIAHCLPAEKPDLSTCLIQSSAADARLVLIGPEGDFTPQEIEQALLAGFSAVSLGTTRLRTETAGMVAATLLKNVASRS
jgi:16S rRNA (uracil1498-N3)-methyltransferase